MMKILMAHNYYQQPGGEDACFRAEADLLEGLGEEVRRIEFTNDSIPERPRGINAAKLAMSTVWSTASRARLREVVDHFQPDVVHFHNTFPLVSPGAYSAVRKSGAAVVQTLHNFRLLCPGATLFRDGQPCETCIGKKLAGPAVAHGCYRGSRSQTAVVTAMLTTHHLKKTWMHDVDRYIVLTEFAKGLFVKGGFPDSLLSVKPNFVNRQMRVADRLSNDFIFVGRLAPEKGIDTLLDVATLLKSNVKIRIIGDGELLNKVQETSHISPVIESLGRRDTAAVSDAMSRARALIFPSTWYEGFPVTIVEAFASGLPVIASRLGSMAEIVKDGYTGLLFAPGDASDLCSKILWAADHPDDMIRMGANARREYELRYTPEKNYDALMDIYHQAIHQARLSRDRQAINHLLHTSPESVS